MSWCLWIIFNFYFLLFSFIPGWYHLCAVDQHSSNRMGSFWTNRTVQRKEEYQHHWHKQRLLQLIFPNHVQFLLGDIHLHPLGNSLSTGCTTEEHAKGRRCNLCFLVDFFSADLVHIRSLLYCDGFTGQCYGNVLGCCNGKCPIPLMCKINEWLWFFCE